MTVDYVNLGLPRHLHLTAFVAVQVSEAIPALSGAVVRSAMPKSRI